VPTGRPAPAGRRAAVVCADRVQVGVTEKTARRRVHSLADSGVIQIAAVTDPRLLGYGAAALIGISATSAEPPSVTAERLLQIPRSTTS